LAAAGLGHGPRDRAAAFLEEYLAAGPRTAAERKFRELSLENMPAMPLG
jgi:hypothetical protein